MDPIACAQPGENSDATSGSTFYALPCERGGESFLLRTIDQHGNKRAILVDAAYAKGELGSTTFDALQAETPDLDRIDIAICTHEDKDHCDGFPNFLEAWTLAGKTIRELWLPGRWALAFQETSLEPKWSEQQILEGAFGAASRLEKEQIKQMGEYGGETIFELFGSPPLPSYTQLCDCLKKASGDREDNPFVMPVDPIEQAANSPILDMDRQQEYKANKTSEKPKDKPKKNNVQKRSASKYDNMLDLPDDVVNHLDDFLKKNTDLIQNDSVYELGIILASSVLRTHARILKIAETARKNDIRVRWFDYDQYTKRRAASGGDEGFLEPVNSVEVVRTSAQPSAEMLALALLLTPANVESLVFLRNGGHGEPPVLFTADSRLAEGVYSPSLNFPLPVSISADWSAPIVTAPHHGSKSNEHAYGVVAQWFGPHVPIYVRNGGKHVRHGLAPSFLSAHPRTCVRCYGTKNPHRLIRIEAPNGAWQMPVHPVPCVCV